MNAEFWTYSSALIVGISGIYYAIRAWQGQIFPNPVSWGVWSVVGVALFLTANSSKAGAVYWSTLVGAWNPTMIAGVILWRIKSKKYDLQKHEKHCLMLAAIGYLFWFLVRDLPEVAPWSMYWMIAVDLFALWPTWVQIYRDPMSDKPFPWVIFGWGFGLSGFAIEINTLANWVLPVYMFVGANLVALPMIIGRIRHKIPIAQWA